MANMLPQTPKELIRFIEAAGESDDVDAKGPVKWDGNDESAALTKDILAFANSPEGGVIVVGKAEPSPGKFELVGLTHEQASTFETTKVATWVNNHCSPPVSLVCHHLEHENSTFVIITVNEFRDVPIICTKSNQKIDDPKKHLLREGTIYVRTANAESAPLRSSDDLRTLVGIATKKRGDEILASFRAMLRGQPLLPEVEDNKYETEQQIIRTDLDKKFSNALEPGSWTMAFYPAQYQADRWKEYEDLKTVVYKHTVRLRNEFPNAGGGTHNMGWGIYGYGLRNSFALTKSGLFVYREPFFENRTPYKVPYQSIPPTPDPNIQAGQWLDFTSHVYLMIEFFMFMSRIASELTPGEEIVYEIDATQLAGRHLLSLNPRHDEGFSNVCHASKYQERRSVTIETLRANWEEECAQCMADFFQLFNTRITTNTLHGWIERFKERRF